MGTCKREVDIVYEKAYVAPRQLGAVYSPVIGPMTRALM